MHHSTIVFTGSPVKITVTVHVALSAPSGDMCIQFVGSKTLFK